MEISFYSFVGWLFVRYQEMCLGGTRELWLCLRIGQEFGVAPKLGVINVLLSAGVKTEYRC